MIARKEFDLQLGKKVVLRTTGKHWDKTHSHYVEVKAIIMAENEDILYEDKFFLPMHFSRQLISEITHYDFAKLKAYIKFLSDVEELEIAYNFDYRAIAGCVQSFAESLNNILESNPYTKKD